MDRWADEPKDGRYQVHFLPASLSYMVDKNIVKKHFFYNLF